MHAFWKRFGYWWSNLLSENLSLSLKNVMVGILNRKDIRNYLIILGKFCMWDCGRNKSVPKFDLFLHKLEAKQETERLIASKSKKLQDLRKRWELFYFFIEIVTDGNMRSFGPDPKKIRSMHSTEALYFCHQCREFNQRLRSVGVCAVT